MGVSVLDDTVSDYGAGNFFGASLSLGADNSFNTARTSLTQVTNAVEEMAPVTAGADRYWQFFEDIGKTAVGYLITKDAAQNNVPNPTGIGGAVVPQGTGAVMRAGQPAASGSMSAILPMLLVGGLVLLAVKG